MPVIADLFRGGIEGVLGSVATIIGKFKADPNIAAKSAADIAAAEAMLQKAQLDFEVGMATAQAEINKIEAGSSDKFTSRWRPFVGWTCGVGLAMASIIGPFFTWISAWVATGKPGAFPIPDLSTLMPVLVGMLGIGTMRSFDKMQGTARR